MTTSFYDCQVLVVGAGPTGLVLAAQLLARGIDTRIIDKGDGPARESRAVSVHARTLELLDTMGLAEAFIEHGHRGRRFRMYAGHRSLLNLDMTRNGSRYGFILNLAQSETERLLRSRVHELGGTIEQQSELAGLCQSGDGVDATLRDADGRLTEIRAGYVAGCDGAHSRVRHVLGLAFAGQPYAGDFLLADVALDGVGSEDASHLFFRPDGRTLVCLPMAQHRWRVVMPNAGERGGRPPTLEEVQEQVGQRAPWPITVSDPGWLACFRCQLRSATAYRRGRVLLAGDAAHIHTPAGGQGMNTGMMDAANLAWKLALVAGGHAAGSLLDTYQTERLPAGANTLGFTNKLFQWSTMRHPVKRAVRDVLVPAATALPAVQHRAARRLSQVSVSYPASPLVRADSGRREPKPGHRFPDVEVRTEKGATRLYRVLGGGRHVLLLSGAQARAALGSARPDPGHLLVDVVEGCAGARDGFALVRPDGVLAARGSGKDVHRVTTYLRQLRGTGPVRTVSGLPEGTLNARQVSAAARPPARDGRARRPAFRSRHGGGEHDRTDVTQRASRLPGDPRCPRRGPHRSDHPPCRGTNDAEHQKPGAPFPAHDVPGKPRQPSRTETAGQPASRPQGGTMHAAKDDLPIGMEIPSILTRREAQWGDLSVAVANIAIHDATEFFAKLPDGRCPCPHWGYVIKGRLRVRYADHEEVLSAGEVYYLAPGHIPVVEEPLEIVEFSPLADYEKTTAALMA